MRPAPQADALFAVDTEPAPEPAIPEPQTALAIDTPKPTLLDDAIRRWRDTYAACLRDSSTTEKDLVGARHGVVMAARARETRDHTIDWRGASAPHLIGADCSCGQRTTGHGLVDLVARAVVAHIETGAEL